MRRDHRVPRAAALAAAHNLQVSGHGAPNLHAHCAAAVPNLRHVEDFHDHQRIERMFFDGVLDPDGGALVPDPGWPGWAWSCVPPTRSCSAAAEPVSGAACLPAARGMVRKEGDSQRRMPR